MKKKNMILAAILLLLCAMAALLFLQHQPATHAGEKAITVLVTHGDQSSKTFQYETEEAYLGDVLLAEALIAGEEGDYGLFITTVDGETAEESKQQWWCITKGGEKLNTSVDTTPIADGDAFELTLTEGYR